MPLEIQHNISLKPFNTFGMDVKAAAFVEITDESQIPALLKLVNTYPGKTLFLVEEAIFYSPEILTDWWCTLPPTGLKLWMKTKSLFM